MKREVHIIMECAQPLKRYTVDRVDGEVLIAGQPLFIHLAGQWIRGTVRSDEYGYYFTDTIAGGRCGFHPGMKIVLL